MVKAAAFVLTWLMMLPVGWADGPLVTSTTSSTSGAATTTTTSTASTTTTTTTTTTVPERCLSPPVPSSCSSSTVGANTADLRIIEGTFALPDQYCGGRWGRLEAMKDGSWGQICDANFGDADARVSCRQMGFADGYQLHDFSYSGRLSPPDSSFAVVMTGPRCTGSESRLQDCPSFGTAPSSSDQCTTPRYAAGVLCLGSQPTTQELQAMCPKLIFKSNDQANAATHPLAIKSYFPGGGITSGFGGTGVSTSNGGLGNYAGTYRTVAEIQSAWSSIGDNDVPNMGGHQWRYPFATKSFCYSSLASDLTAGVCGSPSVTSAPTASSTASGTVGSTSVVTRNDQTVTASGTTDAATRSPLGAALGMILLALGS